ncbi:hypothetical protein FPV67DRAFT_1678334 [Lyophyllum atratum]|nr:hypothetical protein FPV67DRAFT_1678334 [Lyophyllum atratum]
MNHAHSDEPTGLDKDLSPAYTPSPDHHGEQGPRRSFQPAPPVTTAPGPTTAHTMAVPTPGSPSHTRHTASATFQQSGASFAAAAAGGYYYDIVDGGRGLRIADRSEYASYGAGPSAPHSHSLGLPLLPPRRASSNPTSPLSPSSNFARDFYTAGTGDLNSQPDPDSSGYVPPPGPPPTTSPNSGHAPPSSPPPPSPTSPSDDGRPTKLPMPGWPLLKKEKLLVYVKGFTCPKWQATTSASDRPAHSTRVRNVGPNTVNPFPGLSCTPSPPRLAFHHHNHHVSVSAACVPVPTAARTSLTTMSFSSTTTSTAPTSTTAPALHPVTGDRQIRSSTNSPSLTHTHPCPSNSTLYPCTPPHHPMLLCTLRAI